jgi:MFS family permease
MLSDCWRPEQRGRSLAVYSFIPLLGPTIGPILGGIITQTSTWRWAFWSTSAFNACLQILASLLLRETHPPTLLRRKTRRLRNAPSQTRWNGAPVGEALLCALRRPFYLLGTQLGIFLLAIFAGVSFGILYLVLSILPYLFTQQYHQSSLIAGLNFVSLGIGFGVGAQTLAYSTDVTYRQRALTESPKPRLKLLLPSTIAASLGLMCLGWSAQAQTHWIVPNIGIVVFGAGTQFSTQCTTAYVIDVYGPLGWSASATAGIWAMKSIAGFGFPLFGPGIIHAFGWGWASSILATGLLAVGVPISLNLQWHGEVFRRMGEMKLTPRR